MSGAVAKPLHYRVLVIEDDSGWYSNMEDALRDYAEQVGVVCEIASAKNVADAYTLIARQPYHATSIDLRMPESAGGPLAAAPNGLDLAAQFQKQTPLSWAHIFTAYSQEHALEAYNRTTQNDASALPMWTKGIVSQEGDNHYTQDEWAQRILTVILPKAMALQIPLVRESPRLKSALGGYSPLGEGLDYAVQQGCRYLPLGMARSCAVLHRWLLNGHKEHESAAYKEVFLLAETVQHWLWVQAAAWVAAMLPQEQARAALSWPLRNGYPARFAVEQALHELLRIIAASEQRAQAEVWLSHLHYTPERKNLHIVDALRLLREFRNQEAHHSSSEELPWEELVRPLRVVMDAAAFMAAYPPLLRPAPAPDGRWRFSLLRGETGSLPKAEWLLPGGVLGTVPTRFAPGREDKTLYQLWPCADGGLGLLKLWPFAEPKTVDNEWAVWLLHGPDARNPQHVFERSAWNGKESCRAVAEDRWQAIQAWDRLT